MTHLNDELSEYVFEELPPDELESARHHVSQCLECQERVSAFLAVRRALEQLPEVEVPRRAVFISPDPPRRRLSLWWGVPAAAAIVVAVFLAGVIDVHWNSSGVQVVWESTPEAPGAQEVVAIDYAALDYGQIAARLGENQQDRIAVELSQLHDADAALGSRITEVDAASSAAIQAEIQRLRGELTYMVGLQRAMVRDTYQNASSIQLLAEQTGVR